MLINNFPWPVHESGVRRNQWCFEVKIEVNGFILDYTNASSATAVSVASMRTFEHLRDYFLVPEMDEWQQEYFGR